MRIPVPALSLQKLRSGRKLHNRPLFVLFLPLYLNGAIEGGAGESGTLAQGLGPPLTLRIKSDNSTNDVKLGLGVA